MISQLLQVFFSDLRSEINVKIAIQRCDDLRDSERKKTIKLEGLYYDVNMKDLFARSFKVILEF